MKKLTSFDFAYVMNDKKLKKSGLNRGEVVLIMGTKVVPSSSKDPYVNRELAVVAKLEFGVPAIPKEGNEHKAYLVDPRNLEWVGKEKQQEYEENIKKSRG